MQTFTLRRARFLKLSNSVNSAHWDAGSLKSNFKNHCNYEAGH